MLLSGANRLYRRRVLRWRTVRAVLLLLCLANLLDVLRIHGELGRAPARRGGSGPSRAGERVYIASMHFNNGALLREHWNSALLRLTEALGPANVFVSVLESGSWDDSKELLRGLDGELARRGVPRRVELSDVTHRDELARPDRGEGWVETGRRRRELRRIPYLARLRNRTIRDLVELHDRGVVFDKVLFLNDVVFTTDDVLALLDTNGGDYGAACSLDFSHPPLYYDTRGRTLARGYRATRS
ncbi:hypothetical protein CDD83_7237 [Cordyceps sp. RAO-2017]|nr:hypothetical protein CDD83_7237 [Cordyceps sp. RAO-2017]